MAIVDPLRDVSTYISQAQVEKAQLKYVFETHYHADFVSGHLELAKKTGAEIVFGPDSDPSFLAKVVRHEELLRLGEYKIKVLHTPGHTLESTCYVLLDDDKKPL